GSETGKTEIAVSSLSFRIVTSTCESGERYKTGINIAASLHFVAALPNTHYFEYCVEQGALRQTLTRPRIPAVDGDTVGADEAGLGITLNEEVVSKYRVA